MSSPVISLLVVMGVSGCGKSSVGLALRDRLMQDNHQVCIYLDADHYHGQENIDKMQRGISLTDADRFPWLVRCQQAVSKEAEASVNKLTIILACSALKKKYRKVLIDNDKYSTIFIYLKCSKDEIKQRQAYRIGHFFNPDLIDSQFSTLEEPDPKNEPKVIVVDGDQRPVSAVVSIIQDALSYYE
ncbi:hypothetical protein H4219_006413 [Mycoemilia scoparia]|uniref:Gluconokinase n=1 Tax=Mycoemilia scoparia TaxID=417184 RepID=A0A9W7ZPG1_9FUNG|nr:hypothetical protein H4219_006413 [Mycoemilia scoparia]